MHFPKKLGFTILTGVLAVAIAFGAVTIRSVYAQSPTPTPGGQTTPDQAVPGMGRPGGPRGGINDADLASALGITADKLQAAMETANAEAIKEAVAKGLITQAQADQMSASGNNGGKHGFGFFGKPGSTSGIDYDALLAKALNITTDQLQAARQTAYNTSLDTAVKDGTLTQAQADQMKGMNALGNDKTFQSAMQSAFEAAVKQAVTSGTITQAQADAILANVGQKGGFFGRGFDFGGPGGGFGGPGGPGRHGGFGPDGNQGAPTTTQNN